MTTSLLDARMKNLVAYLAGYSHVSVPHMLSIVRKRQAFLLAKMYNRRAVKRSLAKNPNAKKHKLSKNKMYAGEGPLHVLLRMLDLNVKQFCLLVDIPQQAFTRWHGHPMYGWPVRYLELLYYARGMEEHLKHNGVDTEKFRAVLPGMEMRGRYPREKGQAKLEDVPMGEWTPWK